MRDNPGMFEIGASLREARIKRGLTPADVQQAIRIRDRYLQAIEEERWELLPGEVYAKGFLRTYADFLGLDGNLYVDEYNSRFAHHDEPAVLVPERPPRRLRPRGGGLLRPALAVGALVAIVAGVAAWQLNRSSGTSAPRTQGPGPTTATTGRRPTHRRKHHRPHVVALPTRALLVASRGTCWLEVRAGGPTGALLYENTLQQGQSLTVSLAHGPVWIRIGDPPNLDIRMGGKVLGGLPTQTGNVLLTRRGLQPA